MEASVRLLRRRLRVEAGIPGAIFARLLLGARGWDGARGFNVLPICIGLMFVSWGLWMRAEANQSSTVLVSR